MKPAYLAALSAMLILAGCAFDRTVQTASKPNRAVLPLSSATQVPPVIITGGRPPLPQSI